MQKSNFDFSIFKFKKQVKKQDKDLLAFFFFVLYNGFVIYQLYTAKYYCFCNICTKITW